VGFRWQPIEDLVFRGTYSEGFRAPNLGELYGLTQFGATIVDPCGRPATRAGGSVLRGRLRGAGRAADLRTGQHPDHHLHRWQPEPGA
jgi:iron complex outermembrane receptor protein